MINSRNQDERKKYLEKMLALIKENPGIRPSELNRQLGLEHLATLRNKLITNGLVKKKREGQAVRYYSIKEKT